MDVLVAVRELRLWIREVQGFREVRKIQIERINDRKGRGFTICD